MTNKELLEIVSHTLKGLKYKKQITNEKNLILQADKNGLLPLLFAGIDETLFSKDNYEKLQKRFFANVYNDTLQKRVIEKVSQTCNENKLDFIFLKGTHLKEVYEKSYYRSMGDIDLLIKKEKSLESRKIFKNAGFKNSSRSAEHDVYSFNNYFVEVHREIYSKENNKDESPLLRPWDYSVLIDNHHYRLNYTYEGVYLLYHLKKHILSSGIGLRSILDISVFFDFFQNEIDLKLLNELLKETKMELFFQTILLVNKKAFDFDSIFIDKNFILSEKDYQQIIDYISQSGIHGYGKDFNLMAPRVAKKGKIKTVFRLFFPKWSYMKESYSWLKYMPFLLPIAYIIRGFEFLFLKTKYTFKKLKKVHKSNKEAEELENTFKKMGL